MPPASALDIPAKHRTRAFYALSICAGLTTLVGALVLFEWHFYNIDLVRPIHNGPTVPYHTAWVMLASGFGYLAWLLGARRIATGLAVAVVTLTLLTLLWYWTGLPITLEEMTPRWEGMRGQGIAMSPNGALAYLGLSLALIGLARSSRARYLLGAVGFAASIAGAFALPAILGYVISTPSAYQSGALPAYAFLPSVLALLLSLAVLAYAWASAHQTAGDFPSWSPVSVWLLFAVATILYVEAMRNEQDQIAAIGGQRYTSDIASVIARELKIRLASLQRMAARAQSNRLDRIEWESDAAANLKDFGGYDSISLLRPGVATTWTVFAGSLPDQTEPTQAEIAVAPEKDIGLRHFIFSSVYSAPSGSKKFLVRVPFYPTGEPAGFVGATVDVQKFLAAVLSDVPPGVAVRLSDGAGPFYLRTLAATSTDFKGGVRVPAEGIDWLVELDPATAGSDSASSRLPILALVGGLLFTTLLAYTVRLFQISRARASKMEEANVRLIQEIEERTRLEERTRQIIETAYDAFVSIDARGVITDWNPRAQHIFGWSRDEALGRSLANTIVPPLYRDSHNRGMRRFQETGQSRILERRLEMPAINKAGEEFPIELTISSLHDGDAISFNAFIHDITERQAMQRRLSESNDFYLRLFENFPALVWRARADGARDYFNTTWLNFTGRSLEQELGDGWRVNVQHDDLSGYERTFNQALAARGPYEVEFRLCNAEQEYRWVIETGRPFFDLDGHYAGYIGSCIDVSRSKQLENALRESNEDLESRVVARTSELYQTNVQLKQEIDERAAAQLALKRYADDLARTNAELEQFAYVASHDLQEPLRMVSSYAQLLHRRYSGQLDADAADFINFIVEGAIRMQQLIEDLLAFSRLGSRPLQFAAVDCEKVVETARENQVQAITQAGISVESGPLPLVWGDAALLVQLFQALFSNAIKFRRTEAPYIRIHAEQRGSEWEFSFADNGIGIEPQYFQRIFVIFQRLHSKADYPGTGIGLAICKKIVERHGGRIWLESEAGKGSIFYFTLRTAGNDQ